MPVLSQIMVVMENQNLVHAACYSIDSAWIDPWQDKLDVVVIDGMSAIFHVHKSKKFESFQILSSSFINHIDEEFFLKLGFTPCKAEQPLQGMKLQEKKAQKD